MNADGTYRLAGQDGRRGREALARAGTPFRQAHQIVGLFVLESEHSGKESADWSPAEMAQFAPEFTGDLAALLDPRKGMQSREIPGGTGPRR